MCHFLKGVLQSQLNKCKCHCFTDHCWSLLVFYGPTFCWHSMSDMQLKAISGWYWWTNRFINFTFRKGITCEGSFRFLATMLARKARFLLSFTFCYKLLQSMSTGHLVLHWYLICISTTSNLHIRIVSNHVINQILFEINMFSWQFFEIIIAN